MMVISTYFARTNVVLKMKLFLKVAIAIGLVLLAWRFWPGAVSPASGQSTAPKIKPAAQMDAAAKPQSPDLTNTPFAETIRKIEPTQMCPQPEQLSQALTQLQQKRVNLTHQLIDLHEQLSIEKATTLQVLQVIGGDLEVFQFRQAPDKSINFPRFKPDNNPSLEKQDSTTSEIDLNAVVRVRVAIAQQNYDALLQMIQPLSGSDRRLLFPDPEQSLLGRLMIKNPQIPLNVLQQFIDAGFKPNLSDFAALTALDFSIAQIAMLQQHFQGDLQQQWQDNFRSYNLSLLAAENASAELFEYWHTQGIPLSLEPQAPNAFDLIPLPSSEQQLQQQISKVRTLLAAGILPRAADVQSQWLLLLPEQEATLLSELLQQRPVFPIDLNGPDASHLAALQQLQTEFNQLLNQVAVCPKAQQWPAGISASRDFPERRFLKHLKLQQRPPTAWEQMSEQDLDNHKLITEFIQKKDWVNAQILMQQLSIATPEKANFELLMVMMIEVATLQDLQRQLTHITQLTDEQIKHLSEIASSEHREMFKAAGFDIPYNARAEEFHKHRQLVDQQRKKNEQKNVEMRQK